MIIPVVIWEGLESLLGLLQQDWNGSPAYLLLPVVSSSQRRERDRNLPPISISLSFKICTRQFKCRAGFNTDSAKKKRVAKWDLYLHSVLTLQELKGYWQSPGLMAQVGPGRIQNMFTKVTACSPTSQEGQLCLCATPGFDSGIFLANAAQRRLK